MARKVTGRQCCIEQAAIGRAWDFDTGRLDSQLERSHDTTRSRDWVLLLEQVKRDVYDHVLLPSHHAALAQFDKDVDGLEVVLLRGGLRMTQKLEYTPA